MSTPPPIDLRSFFRKVDPQAPHREGDYVRLYEGSDSQGLLADDPVQLMATEIDWAEGQSAQLFSGHRGTGKTTELRRLKADLERNGHVVVHCDMEDHLHLSSPVDIVDFLVAAVSAFARGLDNHPAVELPAPLEQGYFERLGSWLTRTEVDLKELGFQAGTGGLIPGGEASFKLDLKGNPDFKQRLQTRLSNHVGTLAQQAHAFVSDCVAQARQSVGRPDLRVVVLFDSIEHIRGSTSDAEKVIQSVERLFLTHPDKLRLPDLHVVYTVPPWLKIRAPGVGGNFSALRQIPCVRLADRAGHPDPAGVGRMVELVATREPEWGQVFSRTQLERLVQCSGGYIRDLLRLVQEALRGGAGQALPLSDGVVDSAIARVRRSYLPLTRLDARWLAEVHRTKDVALERQAQLPDLARLFENMLVLNYFDDEEWYDIHPLVVDEVRQMTEST